MRAKLTFGIFLLFVAVAIMIVVPTAFGTTVVPGATAGSATAAGQATGNASLASIDGKTILPAALGAGGGLKVDGSGTALPVSLATAPLPAGAATEATLGTINTSVGTVNTSVGTVNTSIGTLTTLLGVSTPAGTVSAPTLDAAISCSAIWVGTGGNIYIDALTSGTNVGFLAVPDGSVLPVRTKKIYTAGTTATNLVCLAP